MGVHADFFLLLTVFSVFCRFFYKSPLENKKKLKVHSRFSHLDRLLFHFVILFKDLRAIALNHFLMRIMTMKDGKKNAETKRGGNGFDLF